MGINNRKAIVRDCCEWRTIVLDAKLHNKLWHFKRRRNVSKYVIYTYVRVPVTDSSYITVTS